MVFIVLSSGQFGVHSSTNAMIPGETATALQPYSGFTVLTLACLTKTLACKNNIKTQETELLLYIYTSHEHVLSTYIYTHNTHKHVHTQHTQNNMQACSLINLHVYASGTLHAS